MTARNTATPKLRLVEFKRALSNLTNNAVQYGNRAWVRLLVDEREIRIRVEDDGPGIPEADMQRVLRAVSAPRSGASAQHLRRGPGNSHCLASRRGRRRQAELEQSARRRTVRANRAAARAAPSNTL